MIIQMIAAFLLAFVVSAGFGKLYIPWLRKHSFNQPLKDEVAKLYEDGRSGSNNEK